MTEHRDEAGRFLPGNSASGGAGGPISPHNSRLESARVLTDWPADKVERRKVADLVPYARNARTHARWRQSG